MYSNKKHVIYIIPVGYNVLNLIISIKCTKFNSQCILQFNQYEN